MKFVPFATALTLFGVAMATSVVIAAPLPLIENGRSSYIIALPGDAIPAEKTAATELQTYLQQVTGATLPIKVETELADTTPQIMVGAGKRAKRLVPAPTWTALGNDGIIIKTQGKNLVLAGSRPRGTIYAVYEFLEKQAGVRWWTPTENTVPKTPTLRIAPQNVTYTPPFSYREHFTSSVQSNPLFATRMRENGNYQHQGPELGGHYSLLGFVHTFDQLLPPEKYFKEHPEWYSDPDNGGKPCTAASRQPLPQRSQLCLSNDAMRAELTKNALEWIRKNPEAGIISISQNDNNERCTDDADMAIEKSEGSPSGPLLNFVNKVAADIEKEYPDFLVETLAYTYTTKPPRTIRPRHNVIVRLCAIDTDFARPYNSEANATFRGYVNEWKKLTSRLYIWDYVTNFSRVIWPHPNLRVQGTNMRYFAKSNVFGMFPQGDAYSNGTGDFVQLRAWLTSKLMWNPEQDDTKLIDEFLRGYYGAAAPHLHRYLNLINQSFLDTGKPLSTFHNDHAYLTPAIIDQAWKDFSAAQAAVAGNPEFSQRVRRERLALDNVIITKYADLARNPEVTKMAFFPKDIRPFIAEFIKTAEDNKANYVSELNTFSNYALVLSQRFADRSPLPEPLLSEIAPEDIATRVLDAQDSQFQYHEQPTTSDRVDDPLASDGKAARVIGQSDAWALQYNILESAEVLKAKPWHAYAVVRVEAKPDVDREKFAFTFGIYDTVNRKSPLSGNQPLGDLADGKYHLVDLGKVELDQGSYMYIAPPRRDDIVAVYVDRMILVQDK
jgi:hypothetical protein